MSADFAFVLPPTGKGDGLQRVAAGAAPPTASTAAEECPFASTTAACDMFRAASLREQQETVMGPSIVNYERRGRYRKKRPPITVSPATAAAAAPPPASEAALHVNAAIAASSRPQRARRPPRKLEVESADADISYKKALEKSRLQRKTIEGSGARSEVKFEDDVKV